MQSRTNTSGGKIEVLTLVQGLGVSGGAERLAREITKRLDPERFERTFCVSRWDRESREGSGVDEALDGLERSGVRFLPLERESSYEVGSWVSLLRVLRGRRINVLHSHMWGSNVWGSVLGTLARTPVIVAHEHTWSFKGRPVRRFLDRELIARRSDAFIAVSTEDRRRMIEIERIPPEDVIFVPNGISDLPAPSGKDVRSELGIDPQAPLVGAVGVLRTQKRFDVLIRAAVDLQRQFPDVRVVIVGSGFEEETRKLEDLVEQLGLSETVLLAGHREDVADLAPAFDVAVNCSDFEGSPLAVMEYMDAARAVVATRVGGVPDLIEDGVNGLLVPPDEPRALAAAIAELLGDPERRSKMGSANRLRRREEFSIETMTGRIEALYEELLDAAHRR